MHLTLASIGLLAASAAAAPFSKKANGGLNVVYWGQNGGGTIENNDLAHYCTPDQGIDVVVLAFLYQWGNGVTIASGTIGQSCYIAPTGEGQQCDDLAKAIDTCKSNGVKVVLSLGGAAGAYSLQSEQDAQTIGQNLWDAYGNSQGGSIPRPFGSTFVDGWDFDLESNSGNQYYAAMIKTLRGNFASDSGNEYWITGAPQCPIPEPNMSVLIENAQFDHLWVQFYNNPGCSADTGTNFDAWTQYLAGTPSSGAKVYLGVPSSPLGATGTESGAKYYQEPQAMADLTAKFSSDPHFGGIMQWAAGFSDANTQNGCTYAQNTKHILTSGTPC